MGLYKRVDMELKKIEKCPMLNSGRILRLIRTQSIRCYKCGEERGVWWFTTWSLLSKRRRGKSIWVMRGFEFRLSLSLSLSELEFLVCGCRLPSFDLAPLLRNLSFIAFLSSDQIKRGFLCFLPQRSWTGRKITFNCFYFLTNFIAISLYADPMRRSPFSILKKVSAPITFGECSRRR